MCAYPISQYVYIGRFCLCSAKNAHFVSYSISFIPSFGWFWLYKHWFIYFFLLSNSRMWANLLLLFQMIICALNKSVRCQTRWRRLKKNSTAKPAHSTKFCHRLFVVCYFHSLLLSLFNKRNYFYSFQSIWKSIFRFLYAQ